MTLIIAAIISFIAVTIAALKWTSKDPSPKPHAGFTETAQNLKEAEQPGEGRMKLPEREPTRMEKQLYWLHELEIAIRAKNQDFVREFARVLIRLSEEDSKEGAQSTQL
jgi:hypothetical protein